MFWEIAFGEPVGGEVDDRHCDPLKDLGADEDLEEIEGVEKDDVRLDLGDDEQHHRRRKLGLVARVVGGVSGDIRDAGPKNVRKDEKSERDSEGPGLGEEGDHIESGERDTEENRVVDEGADPLRNRILPSHKGEKQMKIF